MLLIFAISILPFHFLKAVPDYSFQKITIEKGLSQSTVCCILIDHKGMMWIGTSSGLNRFDRHDMKSYFQDPNHISSLPGNRIYFIAEDSQYNLWIGTNKGLAKYDKEKDTFSPIITEKSFLSYGLADDRILFGGDDMLYQYMYKTQTITQIHPKGDTSPKSFHQMIHLKGDNWLMSEHGGYVWMYNIKSQTIQKTPFCNENRIAALFKDSKNNIYVAPYQKGLICYNDKGKQLWHFSTSNSALTNDIILDLKEKDGKIWIATDGGGINILNKNLTISSLMHVPGDINSLPVNSFICLYKDGDENIWGGSVRDGVVGIKETFIKSYKDAALNSTYGLSEKAVICLFEDKTGILWAGTDGGGINRYNPYNDTFKHYPDTYNEKIVSITDYSDKELLVCLYGKEPYLFNKQSGSKRPFIIVSPEVTRNICNSLYITYANRVSENKIYIFSNYSYIYDIKNNKFSSFKSKNTSLSGMTLFGTTKDAAYLIRDNEVIEANLKNDSVHVIFSLSKKEVIKAASRDKNGTFWLGTDTGLSYYSSQTNEYKKIETQLFYNISTLILDDQDRLWIGAQNMLFSYHVKENKFTIWGESDGFQPNDLPFAYPTTTVAGNIYLGGACGLVKINKNITTQEEKPSKLELIDVLVDGNPLSHKLFESKNSIHIPWNHSSVVIKVISKEKDVFRKRIFQYRVTGTNNYYSESYSHSFSLQTLAPGNYSIQVSCNTKNGDWTPAQELLKITVTPPWYRNKWIISGTILLAICCIILASRNIIKRKERALSEQIKEHKEKANEERIRFLINISHELRTPLTLVCAPLKRLLDEKKQLEPDQLNRQLNNIYQQAYKMKNLLNMVLDINKVKEKNRILRKQSYSLNEWVTSTCEAFKNEFETKNVELAFCLDPKVDTVPFDKSKCEIVLSNLLMNALKFTSPDSQVIISTQLMKEKVCIAVSDQGIGLENVDKSKLFTPFYQGNHDQHGSGIGLSYAKVLINAHGGEIGAYNNKDKGATFYFELPLHNETKEDIDTPSLPTYEEETDISISEKDAAIQINTENYTVLIVEDNLELRTFLKRELCGFKAVYTAEDGVKALEIIQNKQPDIIVSDIMMPRMDGYELSRRIKQDINYCHIPVILLTARVDSNSEQLGYNQGADAYLSKPFEINLLVAVIRNQLKNREVIRQKYLDVSYVAKLVPTQTNNPDEEFLLKLSKVINDNLKDSDMDIAFLTDYMAMSRTSLYNKIKILTGVGANDYINRIRIEKAVQLLTHTEMSITEISEEVGFVYQRYFSTTFKQVKGTTPTEFRKSVKAQG